MSVFNPTKIIFVVTNASKINAKSSITCTEKSEITCTTSTAKPDVFLITYDRQKNIELSKTAGNEYKSMMSGLCGSWKQNCIENENELIKLIKLYTNPPQPPTIPSPANKETRVNQLVLKKIIDKYELLNTTMQKAAVSVHDLRYQFYLRKNYIVNKICEGATSASILAQLKRLNDYLNDVNAVLNAPQGDKIISVIGSMVSDHAIAQLMNIKNPMNSDWSDEENEVNQKMQTIKNKIQSIWKKSSYYFNTNEIGDAFAAVGNPEFEIVFQLSGNKPAPVNIPPNLKNESFAKDPIYKISDTVKNFVGVNYKEFLFSDTCDPMNLKYFSIIKKHDYREEFMPPEPGSPGYFRELNEIAQFRINAHKYTYKNIDLMPSDVIAAVSRKFESFKRRSIDAIVIQFRKGEFTLLNLIKNNISNITAKEEMVNILTDSLKEIRAVGINDVSGDINKANELISELNTLLSNN